MIEDRGDILLRKKVTVILILAHSILVYIYENSGQRTTPRGKRRVQTSLHPLTHKNHSELN